MNNIFKQSPIIPIVDGLLFLQKYAHILKLDVQRAAWAPASNRRLVCQLESRRQSGRIGDKGNNQLNVNSNMTRRDLLLLLLAVGIIVGYTYALDTPQALEIPLRQAPYNFTSYEFNLIYFATFLLIGFFVVPLGIMIDRFPIKRTLLVLLLALLVSQVVIALMFQFLPSGYFGVVLFMRSIFGLAGEGLYTVQCAIMSVFGGAEYEFLAGLALALPFTFDSLNSVTTTAVYDTTSNLPLTWYIGCAVCLVSLLSGVFMNKIIIGKENNDRNTTVAVEGKKNYIKELRILDKKFWLMSFFIFFAEASLGPYNDNLNQLIVKRFNFGYTLAGQLILIVFSALAVFTLLMSTLLRRNPSIRRLSMLVGTGLYLFAHICLFFLPNTKEPQYYHYIVVIFFLFSMAFQFAIYYASITPSVSFLSDPSVVGTAWGVCGGAIGFSQCLVPLLFMAVIGESVDLAAAYKDLSGVGVILAIIPLGFAMWINYYDYQILDMRYCEIEAVRKPSQAKLDAEERSTDSNQKQNLHESLISQEEFQIPSA